MADQQEALERLRELYRVSGGVWECGKPERFSIISMPQSEGEKGEVTFSLRPRRGRSLAPPFPPMGLQNVRKEV